MLNDVAGLSFTAWWDRVRAIHSAIQQIASHSPLTVGFPSIALRHEAGSLLREAGLSKPLLMSEQAWVRRAVVTDLRAYQALALNVELEFTVDGCLRSWRGDGSKVDRLDDAALREVIPTLRVRTPQFHS